MKTRCAVIRSAPGTFEALDVDLEEPRAGEIMVKLVASGLCHSDDHMACGDITAGTYPFAGGHEGAGTVVQVGPNTPGFAEGDDVVFSFVPSCGRCRWCASGMQNLCDLGAYILRGTRFDDEGSYRMSLDGRPVGQHCGISTFSEYTTVSVNSAVKVPRGSDLDKLCLLGCAIGTGWGSAVNAAKIAPGDTAIVMGAGGIGSAAIQGARHAGAEHVLVVDPVEFKRTKATEFGASETFATIGEATEVARSYTNGQGADSVIITVGVIVGDRVTEALDATRKGGRVVVTAVGKEGLSAVRLNLLDLSMSQKSIIGALYGHCSPHHFIPRMAELYASGTLKLAEMITNTYTIEEVAKGFADMHAGNNIRGVVRFDG